MTSNPRVRSVREDASLARHALLALVALVLASLGVAAQMPKPVAAPPADIHAGRVALPDPAQSADHSRSAWLEVRFDAAGEFMGTLPVQPGGELSLVPLGPDAMAWDVAVAEPGGAFVSLAERVAAGAARRTVGPAFLGPVGDAVRFDLSTARTGAWTVRVTRAHGGDGASASRNARARGVARAGSPDGVLLVGSASDDGLRLVSHLSSFDLVTRDDLAFVASLRETRAPDAPLALADASLSVTVGDAGGDLFTLPLRDDGLSRDGSPGDGVFGALLPPLPAGRFVARLSAVGRTVDGRAFLRTGRHAFPMHAPEGRLTGRVAVTATSTALDVRLGVDDFAPDRRLHAAAEVWGVAPDGAPVAVAWLAGMVSPVLDDAGDAFLSLRLDPEWMLRAGAAWPLELRAVRVSDPDTLVPLTRAARLAVDDRMLGVSGGTAPTGPVLGGGSGALGSATSGQGAPLDGIGKSRAVERSLLLSHGYCSGGMWPVSMFSGNALEFLDVDANRSHDEFAQLLLAFGGSNTFSFGGVAHSQGGAALLHLYTYYFSGLDLATPGRLIQSVGTPYQGTPLAGDLAVLGSIFGSGCGTNDNMTTAGSALWLSTIPTWARAEVHYATTSTGGFWCNFITNLVLDSPNDGVVERSRGQLPGAVNMGHKTNWCHTTGMNDPAQYNDAARNAEMDAAAAR